MANPSGGMSAVIFKAAGFGLLGAIGLFSFYFLVLFTLTGDANFPWQQFSLFQPWMSLLVVGFGLQLTLFSLVKQGVRIGMGRPEGKDSTFVAGSNTAISGVSMVACCAHHLVELIPVLGLAGVALFLGNYQKELLLVGMAANMFGIGFMVWHLFGKESPRVIVGQLLTGRSGG
jgi:hypothetical protein